MTISSTPTYCSNHPGVETSLRCIKCDRYICAKCAVRTPTGYRCKSCVREHQKVFDTATTRDYLIAFFLGGLLSFLGSLAMMLVTSFFWGLIIIFLAPAAGGLIGNLMRRIIKGHHARALNWTLVAAVILGALPVALFSGLGGLMVALFGGSMDLWSAISFFSPVFWQIVYVALAVPAAYAQFAGIRLGR
jgi:MFS family permease